MQESGLIRLKWSVAAKGYDLVKQAVRRGKSGLESPAGTYIVPREGPARYYDIALRDHDVFLDLANAKTPEDALLFSEKWGLLYHFDNPESFASKSDWKTARKTVWPDYGELNLSVFFDIQKIFEWALTGSKVPQLRQAFDGRDFGHLSLEWSRHQLILRSSNLQAFCLLELHQALTGGANVTRCLACGVYLPMKFKKGRPADYCSNACKQRHWRRVKARD